MTTATVIRTKPTMRALELKLPPLVVLLLFAALALGLSALLPDAPSSLHFNFPGQGLAAGALALLGVGFALAGVWAFRQAKTTVNPLQPERASAVVSSGIYRLSRNPMYLGMALLLAALLLALDSLVALLCLPAFCVYLTQFQIKPEERALRLGLGAPFEAYLQRTRRWL
ncbi:methyltransferase family protein [Paucibacter sp. Y2R2-4]|uniref:methyltransferase family protein n=1 Tax=Paucibacter sp. Y2R2-4 TaxID=2893553 RepID=UPI0021E4F739|nr:isoprenylcysteine carboxylmethyltransferase family protein [Paucibacter sp. Y2R2-4]MCV2351543.1 isoprenylcysteine carboxylmethyltransferase family protein [Paucibacter sp. Y2R2-4]